VRIAQIPPLFEACPPSLYGGTERVVAYLCDELVALGHSVTLFTCKCSQTRATLAAVRDQPLRLDPAALKSDVAAHLSMLDEVRSRAGEFDILHFHTDLLHFPLFEPLAHRTLTTIHGRLDLKDLEGAYRRWNHFGLASISYSQREPLRAGHWIANVPHGIPRTLCRLSPDAGQGYLAYLGRMAPEKRPHLAIELALRSGLPLKLAAKVDVADVAYFRKRVQPLLGGPGIEYIGEINDSQKSRFLGGARALLFPIDWPEPFGLVMIEAMACGTPVIAWNRGSVPEVIEDGVTGLIVETEAEALAAIDQVGKLDRRSVRARFEQRFGADIMALTYSDVYTRMLSNTRLTPVRPLETIAS